MKKSHKYPLLGAVIILLIAGFSLISLYSAGKNAEEELLLPQDNKVDVVCIDPGHGGHDPGCLGASVNEKNVALAIGLKLGELIEKNYPDVKVVYTRKTDVFVELHKRADIANRANADLFICIHCNAGAAEAHGSETYALGLHKTEANLAVAKRENEVVMMEGDFQKNYKGFDMNSPEGSIIVELYQKAYLNRSLSFASKVQKYFKQDAGRNDRGVKQAGFLVLWKSAMPAVLIETGFLTNVKEEKFLMESKNQDIMANSIYKAFVEYKNEVEGSEKSNPNPQHQISNPSTNEEVAAPEGITFRVQFMSVPEKLSMNDHRVSKMKDVRIYPNGKLYSYTSGLFKTSDEAKAHQLTVRQQGYKDAFVVIFHNDTRISQKEYEALSVK